MDYAASKTDPFLLRVFGEHLPILLEAIRVCEDSYLDHCEDEDGPYAGIVDLRVDVLADILGCPREEVLRRASACERALDEAFGLPLWRQGRKALAARQRGRLRVSRTIEGLSRLGGPLHESFRGSSPTSLSGSVPDLDECIGEIAEAARSGATRHFLYRAAARFTVEDDWIDYLALNTEIRKRHGSLDVRCMWAQSRGDRHLRRPGYVALASVMVGSPHAVRLLPSTAPMLGGDHDISDWINDGTSHRLPPTVDGSNRVEAIVRFHRTLRQLRGVHVWCCPASTKAFVGWVPESGRFFLPELGTFEGRQAVLLPTYEAQVSLLANEWRWSSEQSDEHADDFDTLSRLIYTGEV